MKKLLTGMVALILIIGASAFIGLKNAHVKKTTTQDPLYWYTVDGIGNSTSSSLLNTEGPLTKTEIVIYHGAEFPCRDAEGVICLRGFAEPIGSEETVTTDGIDNFYDHGK